MPLIIDRYYFIGEITISQLSTPPIQDGLSLFIAKREPEFLKGALGYGLYKLYAAGPEDQRFVDIISGTDYEDAKGILREWKGLVNTTDKLSPIANYIYYWYQRDSDTYTTPVGEMAGKSDNATGASPATKMARAWNEMVDQVRILHDFLTNKTDEAGDLVYPEFKIEQVDCDLISKMNAFF